MINNKYTNEQRIRVMAKNKSELKSKNRRAGAAVEATPATRAIVALAVSSSPLELFQGSLILKNSQSRDSQLPPTT
ncbi:MAG: hypothetical protein KatS3mg087_2185 [Patescibacteria group bacterium]|nr:MAG: hypothetical protein KatS3mg087_2185 [Patescibacteria group bacterium]